MGSNQCYHYMAGDMALILDESVFKIVYWFFTPPRFCRYCLGWTLERLIKGGRRIKFTDLDACGAHVSTSTLASTGPDLNRLNARRTDILIQDYMLLRSFPTLSLTPRLSASILPSLWSTFPVSNDLQVEKTPGPVHPPKSFSNVLLSEENQFPFPFYGFSRLQSSN